MVTTASGSKLNLDESFPALADTLQTILDAIPYLARGNIREEPELDLEEQLSRFAFLSNGYRIFQEDWENALWLNFLLKENEGVLRQTDEALMTTFRANYFRYQTVEFELQARSRKAPAADETNLLNSYRNILNHSVKLPAIKALLRLFGEFKLAKSLKLSDVFRSFLYLRSVAENLLQLDLDTASTLQRTAIPRTQLISDMANDLTLSEGQAAEVLALLTYRNPRESNIWTTPIQHVEDMAVLVMPALVYSNILRFLELTAIQKKLKFSEIGKGFERAIKRNAKEILETHPFKEATRVLPVRVFRTDQGHEEIDLAISIGPILFAIEVKYDHFPTEPYEIHNFMRGANDACVQAARKAKFLTENLPALKQQSLIGPAIKSVCGLVLNNTMLLSGMSLHGVSIIDQNILENYLANAGGEALALGGKIIFETFNPHPHYDTREKFETLAQAYFSNPPQLKRYRKMLSKVRFSRRGGEPDGGYELEVFDISTNAILN